MTTITLPLHEFVTGKQQGTVTVSAAVFDASFAASAVKQVYVGLMANARRGVAHTKTRGEVSGGGKKPWRQKGTGRARAGSTRSPIWRTGGVTFGPRNDRNYHVTLSPALRRCALASVLSQKVRDGHLRIVDKIALSETKTKAFAASLEHFSPAQARGAQLIAFMEEEKDSARAGRNIPDVTLVPLHKVNARDILHAQTLIISISGVRALESRFPLSKEMVNDQMGISETKTPTSIIAKEKSAAVRSKTSL